MVEILTGCEARDLSKRYRNEHDGILVEKFITVVMERITKTCLSGINYIHNPFSELESDWMPDERTEQLVFDRLEDLGYTIVIDKRGIVGPRVSW